MTDFKKVNVVIDGSTFKIIEEETPAEKEERRVKTLRAVHPDMTNFNAEVIDPWYIGTSLDDVLEADILCEVEHCVREPDPYEDRVLHRSGGAPINLILRM